MQHHEGSMQITSNLQHALVEMQVGTTDRRDRSHPPQCTTSREDRQIVRMAVSDRSVKSRTVAQHIESVTHHSVSARTIRRRLQ
ncbi:transposable element Tcb1 transposase [Trichonephila clavipes]|nr:transposable element Tcb1 transposase [Trichonephila clavipes]